MGVTVAKDAPRPSAAPAEGADDAAIDAVLLVSFGGPEHPDDVVPFLQNVTRGANIPPERLREVGQHYYLFDGKSPINDQNRALIQALQAELSERGHDWPILWGNRNWHPLLTDTLREAHAAGLHRLVVLTTAAFPSYSGCRSYREALADSMAELQAPFEFFRIGNYALDEGYIAANADAVAQACHRARAAAPQVEPRLIFVTHSIPLAMNQASGPEAEPDTYTRWHHELAAAIAGRVGIEAWELAYCSRSGPPHQPWLEPDINDRLENLAAEGVTSVVLSPIGFTSDHMEVIYDLDTQARETCDRLGLVMARAATAGVSPVFVDGIADRIEAAALRCQHQAPHQQPGAVPGCGGEGCCRNLRQPQRDAVS